jgi:hypothetical protein
MDIRRLYTIVEAIKALKITHQSFCQWVIRERLIIVTQKDPKTGKLRVYVTKESVRTARRLTCKYCGKIFESKHPLKAEYCSTRCRYKAIYASFKRRKLKGKT